MPRRLSLIACVLAGAVRAAAQPMAFPAVPNAPPSAAEPIATNVGSHPVQWAEELGLRSLDSVLARYTLEEPAVFGDLQQLDSVRSRPSNCAQWARMHAHGYEAVEPRDLDADIEAKLRCETLEILSRSRPATRSFVRNLAWNRSLLSLLPSAVATALDENVALAIERASAQGKTLREFDPRARVRQVREPDTLQVFEGNRKTMIWLHALAWGDFNRDGLDDVVIAVRNGPLEGGFAYARLMTFTRTSTKQPLVLIDVR